MAANTTPIFTATPNPGFQSFTSADASTKKTLWTPGADGGLLRALSAVSDDTAAINLDLFITSDGVDYAIGTINIPIGSGTTASSAAVNLLDTTKIKVILSPDGSLFLPSTAVLKGSCKATMTAAKTLWVVAQGADY